MTDRLTPAFPNPALANESWGGFDGCEGMKLRDYFAAAALTGLLAHASGEDPHKAPGLAYKLADDMMKAREK